MFGFDSTAEQVTEGLDLRGQTWLVTGANSGLGLETTRVLALRGARIIATARTEAKAAEALRQARAQGTAVACELADLGSVRAAVAKVRGEKPLTGIIANAGVMAVQHRELVNGIELQLFTNHVGHFALVTGLVDRLAPTGRVVILSSGAHRMAPEAGIDLDDLGAERGYKPWTAYGQSKLANLLFARSLAKRFSASARTANSVHPGVINTNLGRHVPDKAGMYARMQNMLKTVEQGAATQCLVAVHPSVEGVSGRYFSDCRDTEPSHPKATDDALAEALWTRTEAIVAAHR